MTGIAAHERAKYTAAWSRDQYREVSPGAAMVPMFQRMARPQLGACIIDIGAGAGAGSRALKDAGFNISAFDLVDSGWQHEDIELRTGVLWNGCHYHHADFGYCCDVMEHLPTQFVGLAVQRMLEAADRLFLSISFQQDVHGDALRDRLHLTVKPFAWWRDTLAELGTVLDARDLIGEGVFLVGS